MSFPDLQPKPSQVGEDAVLHTSATGVPVNGDNTFKTGLDPKKYRIDPDKVTLDVHLTPGGSVTNCTIVTDVDPLTGEVTLNFAQSGNDPCRIECRMEHSTVW